MTGPKRVALSATVGLGTLCLILWLFFSPPSEARDAVANLNPERSPNPADRIEAIKIILKLALADQKLSGWQQIQIQACKDPDAKVRVAALRALADFAEAKPDQVADKHGIAELIYIDDDLIGTMGRSDSSPDVRVAVAELWSKADVLWKPGIKHLEEMLTTEHEPDVTASIRGALATRVERSRRRGDLDDELAKQLQQRHKLP